MEKLFHTSIFVMPIPFHDIKLLLKKKTILQSAKKQLETLKLAQKLLS
jgi:hypothetical protein